MRPVLGACMRIALLDAKRPFKNDATRILKYLHFLRSPCYGLSHNKPNLTYDVTNSKFHTTRTKSKMQLPMKNDSIMRHFEKLSIITKNIVN